MPEQPNAKKSPGPARRRRAKRLVLPALRYYGSEFILNAETGLFYRVTPTAVVMLKALAQGADDEGLVRAIQEHASVDRRTAIRDVELLLNELSVRGIFSPPAK